jgi:hypothetical protein
MRTSSIAGYFGSYAAACEAVGKRFKASGKYSIQQCSSDYKMHP